MKEEITSKKNQTIQSQKKNSVKVKGKRPSFFYFTDF